MRRLKKLLGGVLSEEELRSIRSGLDVIGDIAILKLPDSLMPKAGLISEAIMEVNRNVRTVLRQVGGIVGDYRLRRLEHLAGERKTLTRYKENGCVFELDVSKVYFSPRLSSERLRIAKLVKDGEVVVNMFAGVGSFSLVIARLKRAKVYSIDLNPYAIKYMKRSLELNRLRGEVIPILGDAREVIEERLKGEADRVLMPLPERANEFLRHATLALKSGGFVHYYRHSFGLDESDAASRVVNEVKALIDKRFEVLGWRRVREVGPRWFEIVLDLAISL
ncbi:MAG: class I SAM-dependent methyltransferase family protein [Thaumarchaeota archaeon]|nr:class I SAM-dependent methyltransferase family protein [Nitrososphaerota archaeon]